MTLPKKELDLTLGDSRSQALKHFHSNERSLLHKGTWEKFQAVIKEYLDLGHARPVNKQEMTAAVKDCYYMPMHGVYKLKESSSTTKLRVVFDASAKTTTGISLNDLLAVGPMLHPTLDRILIRFRSYRVAISGTSARCTGKCC